MPVKETTYSVDPLARSTETLAVVVPLKFPLADALRMYVPEVVVPDARMLAPPGPIVPEPEATLYKVPLTVRLPVRPTTYPAVSLPSTVNVIVPEAVPLVLPWVPTTKYWPAVLVTVIACPVVKDTAWLWPNPPKGPTWLPRKLAKRLRGPAPKWKWPPELEVELVLVVVDDELANAGNARNATASDRPTTTAAR